MSDPGTQRIERPPPDLYPVGKRTSALSTVAVGIIAIGVLYFARDIFVPLALAVLLSFALGPLVAMLRRRHLGLVPAVTIVVLVTFLVIFGVGTFIGGQLVDLAGNLPQYQSNIAAKIFSLRGSISKNGIVGRAEGMLNDL
ncbi:MAG: AI-2E family transporter, partial [Gemmataceae bacterium]